MEFINAHGSNVYLIWNDGNRINDQKCQSEALEGSHYIKSFISFS